MSDHGRFPAACRERRAKTVWRVACVLVFASSVLLPMGDQLLVSEHFWWEKNTVTRMAVEAWGFFHFFNYALFEAFMELFGPGYVPYPLTKHFPNLLFYAMAFGTSWFMVYTYGEALRRLFGAWAPVCALVAWVCLGMYVRSMYDRYYVTDEKLAPYLTWPLALYLSCTALAWGVVGLRARETRRLYTR